MIKVGRVKFAVATFGLALALAGGGHKAHALVMTVNTTTIGAFEDATYVTLNDMIAGALPGLHGGINYSFTGDAGVFNGSQSGLYAAPFVTGDTGAAFGASTGVDTTNYLSTGTGSVSMALPTIADYFGTLWGSVDAYNSLAFYANDALVGSVSGADVMPNPNGDRGAAGSVYVNITTDTPFDTVVASSGGRHAFEFDNVAFAALPDTTPTPLPEPFSLGLMAMGALGLGVAARRRRAPDAS